MDILRRPSVTYQDESSSVLLTYIDYYILLYSLTFTYHFAPKWHADSTSEHKVPCPLALTCYQVNVRPYDHVLVSSAPRTCSWVCEKYQPILEVSFLVVYLLFILNWKEGQWFHSITIIGHDDLWQYLVDVMNFEIVEPEGSVIFISLPYPSIPHYHIHSLVSSCT